MKRIKIGILFLVGVFLASNFRYLNASADTVLQSMTVSPSSQRLILAPGETYTGLIKISNSNSSIRDLKYAVSVGSFSQVKTETSKDDYGVVDHISVSNYNQIMDWITLDKEEGVVSPNATDKVSYTIKVPKDAPAGGQYATIIVRDDTDQGGDNGSNVNIESTFQFASVIFAEITGETRETGSVIENNVPVILFGNPLSVTSMVRNDGNVHTDAKYTLQVWPLFSDKEAYSNEDEPMKNLILPESERFTTLSWGEAPSVGIFKVRQTVEIFGDISTVEKIVLICPLWLIAIITIAIVLVIFWLFARKRNRK